MDTNSYSIFDFLRYCGGSWRNTLYVPCGVCIHPCRAEQRGALVGCGRLWAAQGNLCGTV